MHSNHGVGLAGLRTFKYAEEPDVHSHGYSREDQQVIPACAQSASTTREALRRNKGVNVCRVRRS